MPAVNRFSSARVIAGGATSGDDDRNHFLFRIEGNQTTPPIYGEVIYQFLENGHDFNIEIDLFGYSDYRFLGSSHSKWRQSFSAEEAATAESLIRSFFLSDPEIYRRRFLRARFAGGISFRSNWITLDNSPT
jgi:hypothetical protein